MTRILSPQSPASLQTSLFSEAAARLNRNPTTALLPFEDDLETWLRTILPSYFDGEFAGHQLEFWRWVWSIRSGVRPPPFVAIWSRGGTKSTSAEGGIRRPWSAAQATVWTVYFRHPGSG